MILSETAEDRVVGGYRLLEEVGRGGMGVVFKAEASDGSLVAVKILPPHLAERPVLRSRFIQEAELASRLDHPNLVRALNVGQDGNLLYFAMEFVDGESLTNYIERVGALPEKAAVRIIIGVARALHKAHREGLVHRDVKPENVLLSRQGHVKLADLGLAKDLDNDMNLTKVDRGVGTPASMAPEQFRDAKFVDHRCDVYGLGYLLYIMVTGRLPFAGGTSVDLFLRKRDEDYIRPRKLAPGLTARTAKVIEMALSADPENRPASAREFAEMIVGDTPVPMADDAEIPSGPSIALPEPPKGPTLRPTPTPTKLARAPRGFTDSFDDLAKVLRDVDTRAVCRAVRDELAARPLMWLQPGAAWRLSAWVAGAAVGVAALVFVCQKLWR